MKVLFINHKIKECGVYQYGIRLFEILRKSQNIEYVYEEVGSLEDYNNLLSNTVGINIFLYNYHPSTLAWLNRYNIQRKIKNVGILHECSFDGFDHNIDIGDITHDNYVPRPIFENIEALLDGYTPSTPEIADFINYKIDDVPIIGSFGFGFNNKGFHKIIKIVCEQYDHAIIKLVITTPFFDHAISQFTQIREACLKEHIKPTVKVLVTQKFFTTEDMLLFLKSNTINTFLYDEEYGRGLSSTIDYALSCKKPIGISTSYMFRHIYSDQICLYKTPIQSCIDNTNDYISQLFEKNSNEKLINRFEKIIKGVNTRSQAYQDLFVIAALKNKKNGYFLEIGSNDPIHSNNTYLLESQYNWKGLMVEYDKNFESSYKTHRPNSLHELNDARQVNYRQILDTNDFPTSMDYLQIDLDVDNKSTLDTLLLLNSTVFDKYKFATVTFEHDIYTGDYFSTQEISRQIFRDRGYILIFPNVSVFWTGEYKPFEDWYVHPDLVDMDFITRIKSDESLTCDHIKTLLV